MKKKYLYKQYLHEYVNYEDHPYYLKDSMSNPGYSNHRSTDLGTFNCNIDCKSGKINELKSCIFQEFDSMQLKNFCYRFSIIRMRDIDSFKKSWSNSHVL